MNQHIPRPAMTLPSCALGDALAVGSSLLCAMGRAVRGAVVTSECKGRPPCDYVAHGGQFIRTPAASWRVSSFFPFPVPRCMDIARPTRRDAAIFSLRMP